MDLNAVSLIFVLLARAASWSGLPIVGMFAFVPYLLLFQMVD